ncbi:MAG TPA: hypothetical protein VHM89_03350 [Acidimicrobiales bacterium]|nr:hypothetical protein [Acidimicrobiales bacterium]
MPETEDTNLRDRGRRVPEGEGVSAPFAADSGGPPQTSVFDGAGNESVVTLGQNEDGRVAEGTGATLEDAVDDAGKGSTLLGKDFSPKHVSK